MINASMINSHNITFSEKVAEVTLKIPYDTILHLFIYPVMICLFLLILLQINKRLKLIDKFFDFIRKIKGNFGYIEVLMLNTNKRIKSKMIKLDEFSNFNFKGKKYTLEQMGHFIIGYRKNIPVFLYDVNFILPLIIQKQKVSEEIKAKYKTAKIELTDNEISAISIKLDPQILELVYRKKLISDLYSVVKDDKMQKMLIYILIGCAVIGLLYYTGMLEKILNMVGIDIGKNVADNITQTATANATTTIPYNPAK